MTKERKWIRVADQLPPQGQVVETKIADPDRNQDTLKRSGNLWFIPDGSIYVYYTPTHWRPIAAPQQ
jgi:hypothetical protein